MKCVWLSHPCPLPFLSTEKNEDYFTDPPSFSDFNTRTIVGLPDVGELCITLWGRHFGLEDRKSELILIKKTDCVGQSHTGIPLSPVLPAGPGSPCLPWNHNTHDYGFTRCAMWLTFILTISCFYIKLWVRGNGVLTGSPASPDRPSFPILPDWPCTTHTHTHTHTHH